MYIYNSNRKHATADEVIHITCSQTTKGPNSPQTNIKNKPSHVPPGAKEERKPCVPTSACVVVLDQTSLILRRLKTDVQVHEQALPLSSRDIVPFMKAKGNSLSVAHEKKIQHKWKPGER